MHRQRAIRLRRRAGRRGLRRSGSGADRCQDRRGAAGAPEHALEWLLERIDRRMAHTIVRVALRTYMELGEGSDPELAHEVLYDLIEREIRYELDEGWRDEG